MKVISDDIKKGEFKSVYLLYGEEEYLKKQYRDRLKNVRRKNSMKKRIAYILTTAALTCAAFLVGSYQNKPRLLPDLHLHFHE